MSQKKSVSQVTVNTCSEKPEQKEKKNRNTVAASSAAAVKTPAYLTQALLFFNLP